MQVSFSKYQGTGNDFVVIDDRFNRFPVSDNKLVNFLCDRRFGIGADGLMLLRSVEGFDFEMVYFNSDGNIGSMCGNGSRCLTRFAQELGLVEKEASFLSSDGPHYAKISATAIAVHMQSVQAIELTSEAYILDTGSPHYVTFVDNVQELDVFQLGRAIRYSDRFQEKGINVNFVEVQGEQLFVRTYERGVEEETLSCGTGVTASAIASAVQLGRMGAQQQAVQTLGGRLSVSFDRSGEQQFEAVFLQGPAQKVYEGSINI